jgi:transcriptional regulatory protein RtcR
MLLKAVEEKRFFPLGSDREVASDFQLIAGTHRDLRRDVARGRFREDLFARINLWAYTLPGLAQRPEDLEPHVDHLLARATVELGRSVRFNAEAKAAYLAFAQSAEASWRGNFRDLAASLTRLATLADGGRIALAQVQAEIARLRWLWQHPGEDDDVADAALGSTAGSAGGRPKARQLPDGMAATAAQVALEDLLPADTLAGLDLFDRLQLQAVIAVCRRSASLSQAGRQLFDRSREQRSVINDADRLRKYLQRFGLGWEMVRG